MPSGYLSVAHDPTEIRNDIHVVSTNYFVNRCPLVCRTPRVPVGSTTFMMAKRTFRSRVGTLAVRVLASDTSLLLVDASAFIGGDVLELSSGERVEVLEDPGLNSNRLYVRRGVESTKIGTASVNETVYLISNPTVFSAPRDGEATRPIGVPQFCETWIKSVPVQRGVLLPGTRPSAPFDPAKMDAMEGLMDEMETSSYYGQGEDPALAGRPRQKGLRSILTTNRTVTPKNAEAYKATDFIRDTLDKCRAGGGDPDVLLVSSNFMDGFTVWGHAAQRINAGSNVFGTPIDIFEAPFLGGVSIIEAPPLKPFSAVCLTSCEVRLRMKRNEFWNPRGSRGDASTGEWVAEGAIEVENEQHHAWLEGVKAFSAV